MSTGNAPQPAADQRPIGQGPLVSMSSDSLDPQDRFEWWRAMMEHEVMPVTMRSEHTRGFWGHADAADLAGTRLATLSFLPLTARRSAAHIQREDPENYYLLQVHGSPVRLEQCRNSVCLGAGDMGLFDTSHPLAADFLDQDGPQRITMLRLPRTALSLPSDKTDGLLGRRLFTRSPSGMLLGHFLSGFRESAAYAAPAELRRLGDIGTDLAAALIAGLLDVPDALPVESRQQVALRRVNAFIEHNLGDPDLSPAVIAARHHISVRTLHGLFRASGRGVAATIRHRRLERCRAELTADPRASVQSVAARWGFPDPPSFSRAFRAAYGVTPTEHRRAATDEGRRTRSGTES